MSDTTERVNVFIDPAIVKCARDEAKTERRNLGAQIEHILAERYADKLGEAEAA